MSLSLLIWTPPDPLNGTARTLTIYLTEIQNNINYYEDKAGISLTSWINTVINERFFRNHVETMKQALDNSALLGFYGFSSITAILGRGWSAYSRDVSDKNDVWSYGILNDLRDVIDAFNAPVTFYGIHVSDDMGNRWTPYIAGQTAWEIYKVKTKELIVQSSYNIPRRPPVAGENSAAAMYGGVVDSNFLYLIDNMMKEVPSPSCFVFSGIKYLASSMSKYNKKDGTSVISSSYEHGQIYDITCDDDFIYACLPNNTPIICSDATTFEGTGYNLKKFSKSDLSITARGGVYGNANNQLRNSYYITCDQNYLYVLSTGGAFPGDAPTIKTFDKSLNFINRKVMSGNFIGIIVDEANVYTIFNNTSIVKMDKTSWVTLGVKTATSPQAYKSVMVDDDYVYGIIIKLNDSLTEYIYLMDRFEKQPFGFKDRVFVGIRVINPGGGAQLVLNQGKTIIDTWYSIATG